MHIEISEENVGSILDLVILGFVLVPVKLAEIIGESLLAISGMARIILADLENKNKLQ